MRDLEIEGLMNLQVQAEVHLKAKQASVMALFSKYS